MKWLHGWTRSLRKLLTIGCIDGYVMLHVPINSSFHSFVKPSQTYNTFSHIEACFLSSLFFIGLRDLSVHTCEVYLGLG